MPHCKINSQYLLQLVMIPRNEKGQNSIVRTPATRFAAAHTQRRSLCDSGNVSGSTVSMEDRRQLERTDMNIQIIVNDTHHDKCFRELVEQPVTALRGMT